MSGKSGWQRRQERVAKGLPRYTPKEAEGRRACDRKRSKSRRTLHGIDLAAIKMQRGCADCGYRDHHVALHFDHLPGFVKVANLSRMSQPGWGRRTVLAEIAKCEVVCANCHAIRTYERGQFGKLDDASDDLSTLF